VNHADQAAILLPPADGFRNYMVFFQTSFQQDLVAHLIQLARENGDVETLATDMTFSAMRHGLLICVTAYAERWPP
jgi:hypothetical protein